MVTYSGQINMPLPRQTTKNPMAQSVLDILKEVASTETKGGADKIVKVVKLKSDKLTDEKDGMLSTSSLSDTGYSSMDSLRMDSPPKTKKVTGGLVPKTFVFAKKSVPFPFPDDKSSQLQHTPAVTPPPDSVILAAPSEILSLQTEKSKTEIEEENCSSTGTKKGTTTPATATVVNTRRQSDRTKKSNEDLISKSPGCNSSNSEEINKQCVICCKFFKFTGCHYSKDSDISIAGMKRRFCEYFDVDTTAGVPTIEHFLRRDKYPFCSSCCTLVYELSRRGEQALIAMTGYLKAKTDIVKVTLEGQSKDSRAHPNSVLQEIILKQAKLLESTVSTTIRQCFEDTYLAELHRSITTEVVIPALFPIFALKSQEGLGEESSNDSLSQSSLENQPEDDTKEKQSNFNVTTNFEGHEFVESNNESLPDSFSKEPQREEGKKKKRKKSNVTPQSLEGAQDETCHEPLTQIMSEIQRAEGKKKKPKIVELPAAELTTQKDQRTPEAEITVKHGFEELTEEKIVKLKKKKKSKMTEETVVELTAQQEPEQIKLKKSRKKSNATTQYLEVHGDESCNEPLTETLPEIQPEEGRKKKQKKCTNQSLEGPGDKSCNEPLMTEISPEIYCEEHKKKKRKKINVTTQYLEGPGDESCNKPLIDEILPEIHCEERKKKKRKKCTNESLESLKDEDESCNEPSPNSSSKIQHEENKKRKTTSVNRTKHEEATVTPRLAPADKVKLESLINNSSSQLGKSKHLPSNKFQTSDSTGDSSEDSDDPSFYRSNRRTK